MSRVEVIDSIITDIKESLSKYHGLKNSGDIRRQIADDIVKVLGDSMKKFPEEPVREIWEIIIHSDEFNRLVENHQETVH